LTIDDWWLMIDDWWLMIDDWWLMIDDWWLMIDDWWLMIGDWRLEIGVNWALETNEFRLSILKCGADWNWRIFKPPSRQERQGKRRLGIGEWMGVGMDSAVGGEVVLPILPEEEDWTADGRGWTQMKEIGDGGWSLEDAAGKMPASHHSRDGCVPFHKSWRLWVYVILIPVHLRLSAV